MEEKCILPDETVKEEVATAPVEAQPEAEVCEAPVEAQVAPTQENEAPVAEAAPVEEDEDIKELASVIDAHFANIRNLLKYNKDKDTNVGKLSADIQTYRDGIETKLFKSIALSLIGYREGCKKSLREFKDKALTLAEAKKYLNFLVYDYEDLLMELNVEVDEDKTYYNRKLVSLGFDKTIKVCEVEEFVLPEPPQLTAKNKEGVIEYLGNVQNYIAEVLKTNTNLDRILKVYIENASLFEQGVHQVILYPVINAIAKTYKMVQQEVETAVQGLTEENTTASFVACTEKVADALDVVLEKCSVVIDSFVSDTYDPQKQRLLKVVYSENQEDSGKVANKYTDCYLMDSRVIYPQKVDVIKYKENNN